jgi:D-serine dehydratase
MTHSIEELVARDPVVADIAAAHEVAWENPKLAHWGDVRPTLPLTGADIDDAEQRLARFAPYIMRHFPETAPRRGLIESPLVQIPAMRDWLNTQCGARLTGRLLLKQDSDLAIAGSVKARGGIYEVLKHSEDLALEHGLLKEGDSYEAFDTPEFRAFFSRYSVHVGSTGNLGMSIGIMSAALGYRAVVHMSADAKQWKKDLLRSHGVQVIEYASDYSQAVEEGRKLTEGDPASYFVDDENSPTLFLGYAVAARRLKAQLDEQGVAVDAQHPLLVYVPCGVGGAPGGITFGLKDVFGDDAHVFYAEPTQAPCMILGMSTGLHSDICVKDVGLTGLTAADGLAVGRPSKFVGKTVERLVSGMFTVRDGALFDYMRALLAGDGVFIEPSSCAAFQGPAHLHQLNHLLQREGLTPERLAAATHIAWATGGALVPPAEREKYLATRL